MVKKKKKERGRAFGKTFLKGNKIRKLFQADYDKRPLKLMKNF